MSQGGLSNRIKCLISSMKIANKTDRGLILYWPKDESCNCNFSDLFENKIKEVSKEELREIIKKNGYEFYQNNLSKNKKEFILVDSSRFEGFSLEDIHLKFEETPIEVRKEILNYLGKLKIKKEIFTKVNDFIKKEFSKNVVGVHIRRGDFVNLKTGIGAVSPDESFVEEMKKEIEKNKNVKFFLATEDKETEFRNIFGNKIITYPKRTKRREDEGSVEEALIEMLILSKTNKILGSYGSTFTEMAWFFGKCNPVIKIIINETAFKKHLNFKKDKKTLIQKIKKLIYELITPVNVRILDRK